MGVAGQAGIQGHCARRRRRACFPRRKKLTQRALAAAGRAPGRAAEEESHCAGVEPAAPLRGGIRGGRHAVRHLAGWRPRGEPGGDPAPGVDARRPGQGWRRYRPRHHHSAADAGGRLADGLRRGPEAPVREGCHQRPAQADAQEGHLGLRRQRRDDARDRGRWHGDPVPGGQDADREEGRGQRRAGRQARAEVHEAGRAEAAAGAAGPDGGARPPGALLAPRRRPPPERRRRASGRAQGEEPRQGHAGLRADRRRGQEGRAGTHPLAVGPGRQVASDRPHAVHGHHGNGGEPGGAAVLQQEPD
mmetsp:Transcript_30767/g.93036  ORF Transcript_30767/g.93036 Transcript_30767/m.93036 type:complete len:304 (+) Transcript_30767:2031-2942(+)